MKFSLVAFFITLAISASSIAQQNVIQLQPGEQVRIGYTRVECVSSPLPPQPVGPSCQLLGAGSYNGFMWNFRIAVGDDVLAAKDDLGQALKVITDYQNAGLCSVQPTEPCRLLGAGSYGGFMWNFRVAIGNNVVIGRDDQTQALNVLTSLRNAHVCY